MAAIHERIEELFPMVQVIGNDGSVVGNEPDLTDDQLRDLYTRLVLLRNFDNKSLNLARQGRIGNYLSYSGQEACQLGSVYHLEQQDWIFPTYRDHGAMFSHGMPHSQIVRYFFGDEWGNHAPENVNVFPISIPIATQLLYAVGVAWGAKIRKEPVVTVGFVGNGGTSPGDFHEALNFASVQNTATVIFVQNNHWAISTPNKRQFKARTIAQRALAYDIPGVLVDGQDVLAVSSVMQQAIGRAREGGGPTLVEALTYRYQPHSTAGDDPKRYRPQDEYEAWLEKDPISRMQAYLKQKGLWNVGWEEEVQTKTSEAVNDAVTEALAVDKPKPDDIFDYLYADLPPNLKEQKEQLKGFLARREDEVKQHG